MITAGDCWGPWAHGLDAAEYCARLRAMRAIVRLSTGPRGDQLASLLAKAERDPTALEPAADALRRLAGIDRRHVLASYAALHRPA